MVIVYRRMNSWVTSDVDLPLRVNVDSYVNVSKWGIRGTFLVGSSS